MRRKHRNENRGLRPSIRKLRVARGHNTKANAPKKETVLIRDSPLSVPAALIADCAESADGEGML